MTLVYVQCNNLSCNALGCRKKNDYLNGANCKLCGSKMHEIKINDYEYKLHHTKTVHEEGLLPERFV